MVRALGMQQLAQRVTRYQPVPEYNDARNEAWRAMSLILQTWIGRLSRPVILMPIPLYQFIEGTSDPSAYQERFRELAAATGCVLHDPLPDLQRKLVQHICNRDQIARFAVNGILSDIHAAPGPGRQVRLCRKPFRASAEHRACFDKHGVGEIGPAIGCSP